MARAEAALDRGADAVVVMGDFNTFEDRAGACYAALSARAAFADVRTLAAWEVDAGRQDASWEGWPANAYCRARKGNQRCAVLVRSIVTRREQWGDSVRCKSTNYTQFSRKSRSLCNDMVLCEIQPISFPHNESQGQV